MTALGLARRLGRRWLAATMTGVCAMAVVTTSRIAEPDLFFRSGGSVHVVVVPPGKASLEIDVVQRLSPGSMSLSRDRDTRFSVAVEGVRRGPGPPLGHGLLPEVAVTAVAANGSPVGDAVGPDKHVDLRHPHPCPLDEGCVRRYRVLLHRPGPLSHELLVEVGFTTETVEAEDSPNVSVIDHVVQVGPVASDKRTAATDP